MKYATPYGQRSTLVPADAWRSLPPLHVAVQLQRGEQEEPLSDDLVHIETERMGLTSNSTTRLRAASTVKAIHKYVQTLS